MDGNIEEALALLLRGETNDTPVTNRAIEERQGLVAASGKIVYCIKEGREAMPAVKLNMDITSLAYSGGTLFAACNTRGGFNSGEIVDVGRHDRVRENVGCFEIVPFMDTIVGATLDGKIMDFGTAEKIADVEQHKYIPLCSEGNSLFHADRNGVVYNTMERRAIGKVEGLVWCLHPHNGNILAGTSGGIFSIMDRKVVDKTTYSGCPVVQLCTEGSRIFYLIMCNGAVHEVAGHQRLIDFDATRILVENGKLYAGTQDGKVIMLPLDEPGRKTVCNTGYWTKPITAMAMVPMNLWEHLASNNGREI